MLCAESGRGGQLVDGLYCRKSGDGTRSYGACVLRGLIESLPRKELGPGTMSDLVRSYGGSEPPPPSREHDWMQIYALFQEVPAPEGSSICLLV